MKRAATVIALLATASMLGAQVEPPKPYQVGKVDEFLERSRTKGRPAIVLFNFGSGSG